MESNFSLIKRLWKLFSHRRKVKFIFLILLMVISSLADVLSISAVLPFLAILTAPEVLMENEFFKGIFLKFGFSSPNGLIGPLTLIFLITVIVSSILRIAQLAFNTRMAFNAGSEISIKLFKNTLGQNFITHKTRNNNEIISVISTKIEDVIYRTIQPALQLVSASLLVIFIIFFLLLLNPTLILISSFILTTIYLVISKICYNLLASDSDNIAVKKDKIVKISTESFANVKDIIIDKLYDYYENQFNKADKSLRRSQAAIIVLSNIPRYILEAISIIIIVSVAFLYSSSASGFTVIAMLGTIAMAGQRLLPAFQQIYGSWATMMGNQAPLSDVLQLIEKKPTRNNIEIEKNLSFQKDIKIDNISFKYPNSMTNTINDVSINIPKNSFVAFVGSTGSGKSTLLDIILGLLDPEEGSIFIDGKKLDSSKMLNAWHSSIAHVPQDVYLSDVTIGENIANSDKIDLDLLEIVCKKSEIFEHIQSLPNKFDSLAGENGSNLSGGQRQRIGIARALYKNSEVIILDEATSALDGITANKIINHILSDKTKTIIMVSHNMKSLQNCDLIFEVDSGKIKSFGTYDFLKESSNSFKRLAALDSE